MSYRKIIQLIIGIILSILGFPSESGIIRMIAKELLCSPEINQCSIANAISWILFLGGIIAVLEVFIELGLLKKH